MPTKPEILSCEEVARSRLFRVQRLDLRFSNGERRTYERLAGGAHSAVIIVPMLDEETVLLIREYGVGVEDYELGLPKGGVDNGESVLDGANRELKEEVGYGANSLRILKTMSQSPNYLQHKTHVVLARGLYPQKEEGDEPEPLEVVPCKLSELDELVMREDLTEARSIAAMYMAKAYLSNTVQTGSEDD